MDSNYDMCMDKNGKDTKHTRHIARRVNVLKNDDKYRMHKSDWCEGVLKLADIATSNVGENDLKPRIKYFMVRLDN